MIALRKSIGVTALLILATGAGRADDTTSFSFRIDTPPLEVLTRTGGFADLRMEGFRTSEGPPGFPDIPIRTVLVAIPPDAEPRLEIRGGTEPARKNLTPRPVPRGTTYAPDREVYEALALYPERSAWLGEVGVLRDQRYVEVHLAPLRYDGGRRDVIVDEALEVTVHFEGTVDASSDPRPSRFEPVYRNAFVNYEQGRRFRVEHRSAADRGSTEIGPGGSSPLRKIVVRENGILRLDHDLFLNEAPEFLVHDPANWTLTSRGVQVPFHIRQVGADPNLLEPGEWVQFYGQALDDEPKTTLNHDNGGFEDLYEARDFSDDNVYFLGVAGAPQPQMTTRDALAGVGAPPAYFDATSRVEVDDVFLPLGGADPWCWSPILIEADPLRKETVRLPGLLSGTSPAQVRVHVRGDSKCDNVNPDHVTRVGLENDVPQTLVLPADPNNIGNENVGQFDGRSLFLHDFAWTHAGGDPQLTDPVEVSVSVDDVIGCRNDVYLDWIEIDYRRSFASADDVLTFDYPDGNEIFEIGGLLTADVVVYEITGEISGSGIVDAVRLTSVNVLPDGPTFRAKFRMDDVAGSPLRRFVVAGTGGATIPSAADFRLDRVSTLRSDPTPAELIVVAHPDLLSSRCSEGANACAYDVDCSASETDRCELDPLSELGLLLAHRATQGITSRVARIGDVEDEFNDGLAGPDAITALVDWTLAGGWSGVPPSYLLLVGDASYDYKAGEVNGNYVSTVLMLKDNESLGFFSSDNLLGAVSGGDSMPELIVGRIPVRTVAEAELVAQKIRLYEQSPAPGAWRGHSLFISDRATDYGDFEGREFERLNEVSESFLLDAASYTSQTLRYWSDYCLATGSTCWEVGNPCFDDNDCTGGLDECTPCDRVSMRQDIQDAINVASGPGAVLAQYFGHGNFVLWSDDVLHCVDPSLPVCPDGDDAETLNNGARLPWLLAHNCLSAGFHSVRPRSVGEDWLKRPGGGSIAVFAPSGLGFRYLGNVVIQEVWRDLFGKTKERRLFVPVMNSLVELCATTGTPEGCQFYTLLGDPSMTLALPQVDPATDVAALGGDGVVNLSWTESTTPDATYDVYRTSNLLLEYTKINVDPIGGGGFPDNSVENGFTYYYYVVARDADGFESRWSNFNSNCDFGPDCVIAQPLNFFPPSPPTDLAAVDAETGGRLDLSWLSDPADDDIDFYTVHYGTTPLLGNDFDVVDPFASLTGLMDGTRYFIAVSATNTSGLTSDNSAQISAKPTLVLGVKAPGFIDDLLLEKSTDDAVLSWGEVTLDVYGKPLAVDHYDVFRGNSVQYIPALANRIGVSAVPSYLDDGALAGGQPSHYYLVAAVDSAGTAGGLGNQLPDGIRDLELLLDGGNLLLTWSPVTTDFDREPIEISHYELYAADVPFGRVEIGSPPVTLLQGSIPGSETTVVPPSQTRYYSLLAVDTRGNKSPY